MNKLELLARAEKNGEPVHTEIHAWGKRDAEAHVRIAAQDWTMAEKWYKKPSMEMLIAAAQKQEQHVEFIQNKVGPHPQMYYVRFFSPSGVANHYASGYGPDNQSALENALFKLTEVLVPDNWAKCGLRILVAVSPFDVSPMHPDDCPDCDGTGIALLEGQDGS